MKAFTFDGVTGTAATVGPPIPLPSLYGLNVDRSGNFLLAADLGANAVGVYAIGASGDLSPIVGSPFATGNVPREVGIDPSGRFVYVTNQGGHSVSAFTMDSATGTLTPLDYSPLPSAQGPFSIGFVATPADANATAIALALVPASASVPAGERRQFIARAIFSDGSSRS